MPIIQPAVRAYVETTLFIPPERRGDVVDRVYEPYRKRFLDRVPGAISKNLLIREEDVQILHGFDTLENARIYVQSDFYRQISDLLSKYVARDPAVAVYHVHD